MITKLTTRSNARNNGRHRMGASALLVVPAILLALTACTPASSDSGAANTTGTGQSALMKWQLDLAACLRSEGIDMPDPEAVGSGTSTNEGSSSDKAAFDAAWGKCRGKLGDPPAMSTDEKAAGDKKFLDWAMTTAKCYRDKGYDMPDPKAGESPQFPADASEEVKQECGGSKVAQVQP